MNGTRNQQDISAKAVPPSPWQPIETAPKNGTSVLVFDNHAVKTVTIARWVAAPHDVWIASNGSYLRRVSHWMPLPEPPK